MGLPTTPSLYVPRPMPRALLEAHPTEGAGVHFGGILGRRQKKFFASFCLRVSGLEAGWGRGRGG